MTQVAGKIAQQKKAIAIAAADVKGGGGGMTPWFKEHFGKLMR